MAAIDEIIAGTRRPETTVPLCKRGDLQAQFEELERQLAAAEDTATDSLASGGEARKLAEQIEALRKEMAEATVTFRFRGLPRPEFADLRAEHPPRKNREDGEEDETDVNWDTFPAALIAACSVEPAMSLEQAQQLADVVTNAQWDNLFRGAYLVNQVAVDVPKSFAASAILATGAPSSKPRVRGGSAGAGSSAGSLAG